MGIELKWHEQDTSAQSKTAPVSSSTDRKAQHSPAQHTETDRNGNGNGNGNAGKTQRNGRTHGGEKERHKEGQRTGRTRVMQGVPRSPAVLHFGDASNAAVVEASLQALTRRSSLSASLRCHETQRISEETKMGNLGASPLSGTSNKQLWR